MGSDGSVELYDALTCVTHARIFIGNKPGLLLMAMFAHYGKSRFEIAFVYPSVDGPYKERKARGEIVPRNQWIDKLTTRSAHNALRPNGKEFLNDPDMEFYVKSNSGHTRQVDLQSFGRPLYSEQQSEPRQEEPDYDLPTESIPPSPHPSRSDAPHEDEGTAQAKYRTRRPAPPSIEEERKIKPFAKKPITFMFHATYGNQLISIIENGLRSGKSQSNPLHVLMACIDDVILDDDESEAALTHVPAGRDALLILAFFKDQDYGIRLSEERTALTEQTIEAKSIVAAYEPDGSTMMSNIWIMKKLLSREDVEMYDTKIREFADAFFSHVNSDKHSKEKYTSSETKKRRRSTDQDEVEEENREPSGERSVKPKVTMEYRYSKNLDEFIQELKETYLEIEMSKKDAEEELVETKKNFLRFMEKYNKDPRRAHPKLTECERASGTSILMSISEKKSSISAIEENVPPWTSTGRHSQCPDILLSFHLD